MKRVLTIEVDDPAATRDALRVAQSGIGAWAETRAEMELAEARRARIGRLIEQLEEQA